MKHRNFTVGVFTLLVLFQFVFLSQVQGQNCYKRLSDASGVVPTQAQLDELENASCRLRDSLPGDFIDSFKVVDFGFYLHNESMAGGYPEAFQRAISEVGSQPSSKYYLLFGKQTDKMGIYTKFWVALKLPNQDIFSCLTDGERNLLQLNIQLLVDKDISANPYEYISNEIDCVNTLLDFVIKQRECCFQNRSAEEECNPLCLEADQIKLFLEGQGFNQRNIGIVYNPTKLDSRHFKTSFDRVNDFFQSSIVENGLTRNLFADADTILNNRSSCITESNSRIFITDNSIFCNANLLLEIQKQLLDTFDIVGWIHIWQPATSSTEGILFSKFKGRIYENTQAYFEQNEHCPGMPYEAFLHIPQEFSNKLNFNKVKEYIEKIYEEKNGFRLTVHLEEKNESNLTFFDLYQRMQCRINSGPGQTDFNSDLIIRLSNNLLYINMHDIEGVENGQGCNSQVVDKNHAQYYVAYVTAHEYLHQIAAKSYRLIWKPWNPIGILWEEGGTVTVHEPFKEGKHLGPEGNYNLLYSGTRIPDHHNGGYLPKYYNNQVNNFEKINDNLKAIIVRSFLSYVLYYGEKPENSFLKSMVQEDREWLKKIPFIFLD